MLDQSELLALDRFEFEPDVDIVADEKGFKQQGKQKISNLVKEKTEAIEIPEEQADQFDSAEGEVLPETTSKIKALLKSKAGTNEQVLGGFWNSELNDSVDNKKKLGYDTYADMVSEFNELNKSLFPLTEEEFIEQLRCKL